MVSGGLTRITKMKYKAIIYKTTGVCISNAFPLLRNAELYASHNSDPLAIPISLLLSDS